MHISMGKSWKIPTETTFYCTTSFFKVPFLTVWTGGCNIVSWSDWSVIFQHLAAEQYTVTSELGLQWVISPWHCVFACFRRSSIGDMPSSYCLRCVLTQALASTKPRPHGVSWPIRPFFHSPPWHLLSNWSPVSCPLPRNADDRGMVRFLWTFADPWGIPNNFHLNFPT